MSNTPMQFATPGIGYQTQQGPPFQTPVASNTFASPGSATTSQFSKPGKPTAQFSTPGATPIFATPGSGARGNEPIRSVTKKPTKVKSKPSAVPVPISAVGQKSIDYTNEIVDIKNILKELTMAIKESNDIAREQMTQTKSISDTAIQGLSAVTTNLAGIVDRLPDVSNESMEHDTSVGTGSIVQNLQDSHLTQEENILEEEQDEEDILENEEEESSDEEQ